MATASAGYTAVACLERLRALQQLCTGPGGVDALMCIAGYDGDDNIGSSMIIKYLLLGQSGNELLDSSIGDEDLEDSVLIIEHERVGLYCNYRVYERVRALITLWHGLRVHVLTEQMLEDADIAEQFKVDAFISMTEDPHTVGIATAIPVPNSTSSLGGPVAKQGAISVVEQWVLVQAYALQDPSLGGGGRGFFTMSHTIVEVGLRLRWLMVGHVDAPTAKWIHAHCLPELARCVGRARYSNLYSLLREHLDEEQYLCPLYSFNHA